ncbi:hypothetical protein QN277_020591 [Acacia crassicarpa]|uniref:Uncharacterized protein n=1 Tax=Acacia crassicarpa TaxID=499986 RepID=A0AAE1JPK4_9FABA|nr:hypothetical protein QN277_020591 [Acacia crassicarpa]
MFSAHVGFNIFSSLMHIAQHQKQTVVESCYDIADPSNYSLKLKRRTEATNNEPLPVDVVRGTKKTRSGADATDQIMAERRR